MTISGHKRPRQWKLETRFKLSLLEKAVGRRLFLFQNKILAYF